MEEALGETNADLQHRMVQSVVGGVRAFLCEHF